MADKFLKNFFKRIFGKLYQGSSVQERHRSDIK